MNKARSLIMVIIISNYPIKVTAANIVDMSLATFTDVSTNNIVIHENLHTYMKRTFLCFPLATLRSYIPCDKTDTPQKKNIYIK